MSEENVEIVRRCYAALDRRDWEGLWREAHPHFELRTQLQGSRLGPDEAQTFIEAYFARYPSVRQFIDDTIANARETGVVRTLLGRLRRLPDLKARNPQVRAEAERQAMNTPVQGTAADLIKKAMLDLDAALRARGSKARLIMQIHDELVLEVPETEAEDVRALVQRIMEGALELNVPLVAEARLGRNWAEAH